MGDELLTCPGHQINGLPGVPVCPSPTLHESFGSFKAGDISISWVALSFPRQTAGWTATWSVYILDSASSYDTVKEAMKHNFAVIVLVCNFLHDGTIQYSVITPLLMVMHDITVTDSKFRGKYRVIQNDCRGFNNCHLVLQMQPHVISFYGVTSRISFMFLLFPQVSRNWRYKSEPPFKPSPLTFYKQFGMNSIIVLMFVESQTVHI